MLYTKSIGLVVRWLEFYTICYQSRLGKLHKSSKTSVHCEVSNICEVSTDEGI